MGYGSDSEDSAYTLYKKLCEAFTAQEIKSSFLREIHQLLQRFRSSLLNPLSFKTPNSEDRQQIESGSVEIRGTVVQLSDQEKETIFKVTNELSLNEKESAILVFDARKYMAQRFSTLLDAAIDLFYEERQNLLISLLTLLQGRNDQKINSSVRQLFKTFTNDLVKDKLLENLSNLIESLNNNMTPTNLMIDRLMMERNKIAECLFYACFDVQVTGLEVQNMMTLLSKSIQSLNDIASQQYQLSTQRMDYLISKTKEQQSNENTLIVLQKMREELFKTTYIIAFSIACALNPFSTKVSRYNEEDPPPNLLDNNPDDFIKKFEKQLRDSHWKTSSQLNVASHFQAFINLLWSQCLIYVSYRQQHGTSQSPTNALSEQRENAHIKNASAVFHAAVKQHVFSFLANDIVNSRVFQNDEDNKEFFIGVLSDLVNNILKHEYFLIDQVLADEIEKIRKLVFGQEKGTVYRHFDVFVNLLAVIYKDCPTYARKYWIMTNNQSNQPTRLNIFVTRTCCEYISTVASMERRYPSSFVPYLEMLSSMAGDSECALRIYQSLKDSIYPLVSWDRFFEMMQIYRIEYTRQQQQQQQQDQYMGKDEYLSPSEIDQQILAAVLGLIKTVVKNSTITRDLMLENAQWNVLNSLFGLIYAGPVTTQLMGQMFKTLAAFVEKKDSPEIATFIWKRLEQSQILQMDQNQRLQASGAKYQLEQVETMSKTYHETIGFLCLINALIGQGIPHNLGIETRPPGISPYLTFIKEDIFEKFNERSYKSEEDKWIIVENCLQIFLTIMENYEPSPQDFADSFIEYQTASQTVAMRPLDKPPGFKIMRLMLNNTIFKYQVFNTIAEECEKLETMRYESPFGAIYERCNLLSMMLIENVLSKQEKFKRASLKQKHKAVSLNYDLNDYIVNNHLIRMTKYIGYPYNAKLRYFAVKILHIIASQSHHVIVPRFAQSKTLSRHRLMRLFIDRLHDESIDYLPENYERELEEPETPDKYVQDLLIENTVRQTILDLLISGSDSPKNSLTHFLCGYNIDYPEQSDLLTSGTHCLDVIMSLIRSNQFQRSHPHLIEQCYELIYKLCQNSKVCKPTLAYLERYDFFGKRHLHHSNLPVSTDNAKYYLNIRSYIMKIVSLQIYVNTLKDIRKQKGVVQKIIGLLFGQGQLSSLEDYDYVSLQSSTSSLEQKRTQMLELLDAIELSPKNKPTQIELSLPISIEKAKTKTDRGVPMYNIPLLHRLLLQFKHTSQSGGRMNHMMNRTISENDIYEILQRAVQWNSFFEIYAAIYNAFEGWKQVVELTLSRCYNMIDEDARERVLYELVTTLCFKLLQKGLSEPLENSMSQVILRIMTKLRESKQSYVPEAHGVSSSHLPVDQCLNLFRGILQCILRDGISQLTRSCLYATLLNYLQFTRRPPTLRSIPRNIRGRPFVNGTPQSSSYFGSTDSQELLDKGNEETLAQCDIALIMRVSRDALDLDPRNRWKAVAYATLDALFAYDRRGKWIQFLENSGLLQQFFDSLLNQDKLLQSDELSPINRERAIYIYESIASFFTRLAQTEVGSESLARYGMLHNLTTGCKYIDLYRTLPSISVMGGNLYDEEIEEAGQTYQYQEEWMRQLLIPILRIVVSIFSNSRKDKRVAEQVLLFIQSHHKAISGVLKDGKSMNISNINIAHLEEIRLVTCLFYLLSHHQDLVTVKLKHKSQKYENLLLNTLMVFSSKSKWKNVGMPGSDLTGEHDHVLVTGIIENDQNENTLARDICKNIISYCESISRYPLFNMSTPGRILFTPNLSGPKAVSHLISSFHQSPTLSILKLLLENTLKETNLSLKERLSAYQSFSQTDEMSIEQLQAIIHPAATHEKSTDRNALNGILLGSRSHDGLSSSNQQQVKTIAQIVLSQKIAKLTQQISADIFIIENSLLVLWRHLSHFLSQHGNKQPSSPTLSSSSGSGFETTSLLIDPSSLSLSKQERDQLQQDASTLLKGLLDDLGKLGSDDYIQSGFIEFIVRKLRRLVASKLD